MSRDMNRGINKKMADKEIIDKTETYKSESTRREVKKEYIGGCLVAFRGEEGRNKLRKAAGIGKYEEIRRYPNGGTR